MRVWQKLTLSPTSLRHVYFGFFIEMKISIHWRLGFIYQDPKTFDWLNKTPSQATKIPPERRFLMSHAMNLIIPPFVQMDESLAWRIGSVGSEKRFESYCASFPPISYRPLHLAGCVDSRSPMRCGSLGVCPVPTVNAHYPIGCVLFLSIG